MEPAPAYGFPRERLRSITVETRTRPEKNREPAPDRRFAKRENVEKRSVTPVQATLRFAKRKSA
jgi:hypothetical protein